jgi:hypothetical protein
MNYAIQQKATRLRRFLFNYLQKAPVNDCPGLIGAYEDAQAIESSILAELPGMPEQTKKLARGTREEVLAYCLQHGLTVNDAEWFFDKNEGCGWKIAGKPISNWQSVIRAWRWQYIFPSQKNPQTGRPQEKSLTMKIADQTAAKLMRAAK